MHHSGNVLVAFEILSTCFELAEVKSLEIRTRINTNENIQKEYLSSLSKQRFIYLSAEQQEQRHVEKND
jgi:predicted transcriptional regulator